MANEQNIAPVFIENATLAFRNFSGVDGRFNQEGNRSFCVELEKDIAKEMEANGWNVKYHPLLPDEDEPRAFISVSVKWNHNYPQFNPHIIMINSHGKRELDESNVAILDGAVIANADVALRAYRWEMNGKTGVKAMLKSLYVTLEEDEFERKYASVPDLDLSDGEIPDSTMNTTTFAAIK